MLKIGVGIGVALLVATSAYAETNGDSVAAFASELPRTEWGGAMYWLEMKTIIGWEKMILVVGYAANRPVCERLAVVARADAPDREFRCTTAN